MEQDQEPILVGQDRLLDHMVLVEQILDELRGRRPLHELIQAIGTRQVELDELTSRVDALAAELTQAARDMATGEAAAARRAQRDR